MHKRISYFIYFLIIPLVSVIINSCTEDNNPIAPYVGSPALSQITIEENSFRPKITWLGGYVSVLGVNRGTRAALDTSLVWLIKSDGNNLKYPVQFGIVPGGASELTSQFGGTSIDSLNEDEVYSFWVLKEDVWNQISANPNSKLVVDTLLESSQIITGDSIRINPFSYSNLVKPLDVFINIRNVQTFGRLGEIFITETKKSNVPMVTWSLRNSTDSLVSVIGIAEGTSWFFETVKWDVYSERDSNGTLIFGKDDVISPPVFVGEEIPQTREFVEFTLEGLERNKTYYLWIANKEWDGENRGRTVTGYSFATFNVE